MTDENKTYSITIPGDWKSKSAKKTKHELKNLLKLRSQNDIELHVEQVRERDNFNE